MTTRNVIFLRITLSFMTDKASAGLPKFEVLLGLDATVGELFGELWKVCTRCYHRRALLTVNSFATHRYSFNFRLRTDSLAVYFRGRVLNTGFRTLS